jgi:ubiquitin
MQSKPKPSRVPAKRTQVINFAVFQQTARPEHQALRPRRRAERSKCSLKTFPGNQLFAESLARHS